MNRFILIILSLQFLFPLALSSNAEDLKYLVFDFDRNITLKEQFTPSEFYEKLFYNQIYVKMKVGSKKQEIPFYLYLRQHSLIIQSANSKNGQVKGIFNELESDSYKFIKNQSFYDKLNDYDADDLGIAYISEDNFYFDSSKNSIMKFYLSIENYDAAHITEGGKIGLDLDSSDIIVDKNMNFVYYLAEKKYISSYNFSILYDSSIFNEYKGKLYIGADPHKILNIAIDKQDLKTAYRAQNEWAFLFNDIFFDDKIIQQGAVAQLYPEFGFISGHANFFNELKKSPRWSEYFNKTKKCHTHSFYIKDFESYEFYRFSSLFTGYYCDKDVDINDITPENITFRSIDLEYDFVLNRNDIWIEKNGYKYFLILSAALEQVDWIFGAPFFKKYQLTFNLDSKQIGVYTNINFNKKEKPEESSNQYIIYICIIAGLVVLSGMLSFFLIRLYVYLPRKKRANELLDDDFEYKTNENQDNKIVPDDENK